MKLSNRHNTISIRSLADIKNTSVGVGVSSTARAYWNKYFDSKGDKNMTGQDSDISEIIAAEYAHAMPDHRFVLKSGEIGEIRKSKWFYFVGAVRGDNKHDVIVMLPFYRPVSEQTKKKRLTNEWMEKARRRQ